MLALARGGLKLLAHSERARDSMKASSTVIQLTLRNMLVDGLTGVGTRRDGSDPLLAALW